MQGFCRYWTPAIKNLVGQLSQAESEKDSKLKSILQRLIGRFCGDHDKWRQLVSSTAGTLTFSSKYGVQDWSYVLFVLWIWYFLVIMSKMLEEKYVYVEVSFFLVLFLMSLYECVCMLEFKKSIIINCWFSFELSVFIFLLPCVKRSWFYMETMYSFLKLKIFKLLITNFVIDYLALLCQL